LTFFGFCATVFSSIAAPRNSLIVSKLWDDPPLQTTFMVFFILGSEAEILTIEILEKIPKISSFFGHARLYPISHLAFAKTTFPPLCL
jgi:hypothetical protein